MPYRSLFLILFFVLTNANASTGGKLADPDIFRYLISISHHGGPSIFHPYCLGAQIAPDTIITAVHCAKEGKPHAGRWLSPQELHGIPLQSIIIQPPAGLNNLGVLITQLNLPSGNLYYDVSFDPYAYLKDQFRQELLVDAFGWDKAASRIYTGKNTVMIGDKCLSQANDLIEHEGNSLTENEKQNLGAIITLLQGDPKSLFCSFLKKKEPFQPMALDNDSGSPLVFTIDGKAKLAGLLMASVPLPSSRQYSQMPLYLNIATAVNRDFLETCAGFGPNHQHRFAVARTTTPTNDQCHHRNLLGDGNIAALLLLLIN